MLLELRSTSLAIHVLGKTDRAGLGDAFQSRGDIDAVAHTFFDDIADMDADPELDEPAEADDVGGQARGKCARLAHRAHAGWIGGRDKAGWLVLSRDHGVRNLVCRAPAGTSTARAV